MDGFVDPRGGVDDPGGVETTVTMGSQPPPRSVAPPVQLEMGRVSGNGRCDAIDDVFVTTVELVNSGAYQKAATFTPAGLRKRLAMIKDAGLPPMRVVRLSTLIELGRIPCSTEGHAVDALQEVERLSVAPTSDWDPFAHAHLHAPLLVFVSHVWARPHYCAQYGSDLYYGTDEWKRAIAEGHQVGVPDDPGNAKAKALIHWGKQELWERRKRAEVLVRGAVKSYNRRVAAGDSWREVIAHVFLAIFIAIVLAAWAAANWWICLCILPAALVMIACTDIGKNIESCKKAGIAVTGRHAKDVEAEVASTFADLPTEVLFFIDYTCVDQKSPAAEIGALPAFVSACSEILAYYDEAYAERAWCRAEMLLAYAFTGDLHRNKFAAYAREMEAMEIMDEISERQDAMTVGAARDMELCATCSSALMARLASYCKEYEGGNWISVIRPREEPGVFAHRSEDVALLDPDEGNVTNPGDMDLISRLKQCAVASASFTCCVAYQNMLSSSRPRLPRVEFDKNDRCWSVTMNIKRVLVLPISVAWYLALFLPIELVSFLVQMTLCAPCAAYSGKRSMQVGKTNLSLRDRHTYLWGHHPWGEGPIEHAIVPAQTFRLVIPEGSVPGQTINVKVPAGFGQSGQTRTIVVPPPGQAYVDVPLNSAVVLHGVAPPAGRQGQMFQVLVPDGMRGGQRMLVEIPSGRMEVEIPQGLEVGQVFRFLVDDPAAPQQAPAL